MNIRGKHIYRPLDILSDWKFHKYRAYTRINTHRHIHIHTRTHARTRTHTHIHTYTRIHSYTHTHSRTHRRTHAVTHTDISGLIVAVRHCDRTNAVRYDKQPYLK